MKPNCVIVCVDFADLLAVTLPKNRHHFESVVVVSTERDTDTNDVAYANNCLTYNTDAFYRNGADFNKFLTLEEGLDVLGRDGWICILDADILLPREIPWLSLPPPVGPTPGRLYSPLRRMLENWDRVPDPHCIECQGRGWILVPGEATQGKEAEDGRRVWETKSPCPACKIQNSLSLFLQESEWWQYPIHRNIYEWAGYCQLFHGSDSALGTAPWHQTNWRHAGGADSFFQRKWDVKDKIRPPFECLHIGQAGQNWCGRVSPTLSGDVLKGAEERLSKLKGYIADRRKYVSHGGDRHRHEKL